MITSTVVADSIAPSGRRLTTMVCRYPRFIHSEVMTHRVFSRNAASSRAIPVSKMLDQVRAKPAMPVWWGKNQPGMQAREELATSEKLLAANIWLDARDAAIEHAQKLVELGAHKQIVNRILEPWMEMTLIITATEWDNYFNLRTHPDAQPEIQALALSMQKARDDSFPEVLQPGDWHVPFVALRTQSLETRLKCSVARCARVSYKNHDGSDPDAEKDIKLHDGLLASGHMSPFEHQAQAMEDGSQWWGNFAGWMQYRKTLPHEAVFKNNRTNNGQAKADEQGGHVRI
jgi:thymidylate synthase ThyX